MSASSAILIVKSKTLSGSHGANVASHAALILLFAIAEVLRIERKVEVFCWYVCVWGWSVSVGHRTRCSKYWKDTQADRKVHLWSISHQRKDSIMPVQRACDESKGIMLKFCCQAFIRRGLLFCSIRTPTLCCINPLHHGPMRRASIA